MAITINGDTGVSGVDGTVSNPALEGTDSNTGVYFPAADTVGLITNGSERMRVDSSGNVGIGTSSPVCKEHVKSSGEILRLETTGTVSSGGAAYQTWFDSTASRQAYIGFGGANNTFQINLDANGPLTFSTNNTERMRIDSSGNLLVGTTTQATGALVTVNGSIQGTITRGTSQASTSGTSITFTGIPSWARRITMMLQGVSTSSTSQKLFQLGTASGFITTGYLGSGGFSGTNTSFTQGFGFGSASGTDVIHGIVTFVNLTSNTWVASGTFGQSNAALMMSLAGSISSANLGGVLTQVRMTTANGTDTFTAGNINILYEG